jgi:hypothetical protein
VIMKLTDSQIEKLNVNNYVVSHVEDEATYCYLQRGLESLTKFATNHSLDLSSLIADLLGEDRQHVSTEFVITVI